MRADDLTPEQLSAYGVSEFQIIPAEYLERERRQRR